MKSNMGPMRLLALVWVVVVGACAVGAPAAPEQVIAAPAPVVEAHCGNGKFEPEKGELCDCENRETSTQCVATGKTCDMLMNGMTGQLLCEAKTCMFSLLMCKPIGGAVAGTGGGAAGRGR